MSALAKKNKNIKQQPKKINKRSNSWYEQYKYFMCFIYWFKFDWTVSVHSSLIPQTPNEKPEGSEAISSSASLKRKEIESLNQVWEEEMGL